MDVYRSMDTRQLMALAMGVGQTTHKNSTQVKDTSHRKKNTWFVMNMCVHILHSKHTRAKTQGPVQVCCTDLL